MIQIKVVSDAPLPLQAAIVETIQKALEARRHVCVLDAELQNAVGEVTEKDHMQARGQDILVKKGD